MHGLLLLPTCIILDIQLEAYLQPSEGCTIGGTPAQGNSPAPPPPLLGHYTKLWADYTRQQMTKYFRQWYSNNVLRDATSFVALDAAITLAVQMQPCVPSTYTTCVATSQTHDCDTCGRVASPYSGPPISGPTKPRGNVTQSGISQCDAACI
jgi:hypothetical protein